MIVAAAEKTVETAETVETVEIVEQLQLVALKQFQSNNFYPASAAQDDIDADFFPRVD